MTATFTFETKSQLAKLLATENITIQHNPNAKTAWFNVRDRVLTLPVWQNISEDLYDLLVVHEVGHALDTAEEAWLAGIETVASQHHKFPTNRQKAAVKDFLNVIEDARIDKRQKRRYPGSRKNYVKGYAELHERDFFKLRGKEINTLTLIDRANIYFKGGVAMNIKFTNEERKFIVRMENAETFDEVVAIASDMYGYALREADEKKALKQEQAEEDNLEEGDRDIDTDDFEMSDEDMDGEGDQQDLQAGEESDEESDNTETSSSIEGNSDDTDGEDKTPEVLTEKAARENTATIVANENIEYFYVDLPKVHHDIIVDDYKVVMEQMNAEIRSRGYDYTSYFTSLTEWKAKERDAISFMVKEFEMKKAADAYARTAVSKTGVIDTNKVHAYKFNDDIFRKMTTVRDGKNHGFVMFLDWSGSMCTNLEDTMKQLFSLVLFCKRVQIPFEVYTFRDPVMTDGMEWNKKPYTNTSDCGMEFSHFKLRNILSSRMTLTELNMMLQNLWLAARATLMCDMMNGTPLDSAILAADKLVNDFRKRNKLQVVSTIFLTDGASSPLRFTKRPSIHKSKVAYIFRDTMTKKTYYHNNRSSYGMTDTLLRVLKDRTGCNLVGFFQCGYSFRGLSGMVDSNLLDSPEARESWKNNNFLAVTSAGYDEYYIVRVDPFKDAAAEMKVNSNMSKNQVTKEFMKYSNKKAVNRIMLTKFIDRVTKSAA